MDKLKDDVAQVAAKVAELDSAVEVRARIMGTQALVGRS